MLDEQAEQRFRTDEREIGNGNVPAEVSGGSNERCAALIGASAQHHVDTALTQRLDREGHVVLESRAARIGRLGGDRCPSTRKAAGYSVGSAPAISVDLVEDAE